MTAVEAAKKLEISVKTVYEMCSKGVLAHQRFGVGRGSIRITAEDLENYVASRRVEARGPAQRDLPERTGMAIRSISSEILAQKARRRDELAGRRPEGVES